MPLLEETARRRRRKSDVQKLVLESVATAGLLSIALVAPNVLGAMGKLGILPHERQKESIQSARKRLIAKGLLKEKQGALCLTPAGRQALDRRLALDGARKKPRRWDKKWRMLIFDIAEHRKAVRNQLRTTLNHVGFIALQKSVWIYPYPCEELIALFKHEFKIGKEVLYVIVDTFEGDSNYQKVFGLGKK